MTPQKSGYLLLTMALLFVLTAVGCVRRTVIIRTEPQGARVILNDEEVGTSPVSVDFTWYGDSPIDFFAEALVPFTIHDQHEMFFSLEARKPVDRDQLVKDAVDIRDRVLYGKE